MTGTSTHISRAIVFIATVCPFLAGDLCRADRSSRTTPVVSAVREARDAVVNISTTRQVESRSRFFGLDEDFLDLFLWGPPRRRTPVHSLGSGFVIHPAGYIVTNAHVVERASEITVTFADGRKLPAERVSADPEHDLYILKVNTDEPLKAVKLGSAEDLMIGETVIAIGNPLGYQHTVTVGVVSAVGRTLQFSGGQVYEGLIQTDASINPGNSGGPLLNIDGELIGINTAIRGDAQNIGFAISVDRLKESLPQLLDAESIRRINLGAKFLPERDNRAVRVISVNADSPSDRAGLEAGDLILAVDQQPLQNMIDFYVQLLERPLNESLHLRVRREDKALSITVPFRKKPKPDGEALARRKLGLVLRQLSSRDAREIGLQLDGALLVKSITRGGPADRSGRIERGDIIYQLDRYRVKDFDGVGQILENVQAGRRIRVGFIRISGRWYYTSDTFLTVR